MDLENRNMKWTKNLEEYLKTIGEKSYGYSYLHKKCRLYYSNIHSRIQLPVIVLTSFLGALGVGNATIFKNHEEIASQIIGFATLSVAILSTLSTYYNFAKMSENHKHTGLKYSKIFRLIHIELSLPKTERISPQVLLKLAVRDEYEELQKTAPLIPSSVIKQFKILANKEAYLNISKPSESNGLESIEIYITPPPTPSPELRSSPQGSPNSVSAWNNDTELTNI